MKVTVCWTLNELANHGGLTELHAPALQVNVSTDPTRTVDITEGENTIVDYTYSVKWRETATPFERRMDKYSRYSFLPQHLEVRSSCIACFGSIPLSDVLRFMIAWNSVH